MPTHPHLPKKTKIVHMRICECDRVYGAHTMYVAYGMRLTSKRTHCIKGNILAPPSNQSLKMSNNQFVATSSNYNRIM